MLEVKKICKSFGNVSVLKDIEFNVGDGEIYGLVGKNGAGKTTLMNIIAGITDASLGNSTINGSIIDKDALAKGLIGYLPDIPSFYDYLTVKEYLSFLNAAHPKYNISPSKINSLVQLFDINENSRIKILSRGNKQKLGIIASIISNPKLLLLDEPTSALDPIGRRDVMALIKELKENGMSIVLSTHILSDIETVCDRIGFLHNGTIVKEISLNSNATNYYGYHIKVVPSSNLDSDYLKKLFKNATVSIYDNSFDIQYAEPNINQSAFFQALAHLPWQVQKIEPLGKVSLESIMEEVLSR